MNKPVSLYLDLVRFLAAVAVLLSHASGEKYDGEWLSFLHFAGHDAVIVFFVLSGFVISFVATTRENNFRLFSISRISRLYSVIIPAILITLLADAIGRQLDPALYSYISTENYFQRIASNFFLVNELQFYSIRLFSNGPFWSLGYEFWYYVLFSAYFFLRGKVKWMVLVVLFLTIGVKILLMFPIWLAGAFVFKWTLRSRASNKVGWWLFLGSILGYLCLKSFHITKLLHDLSQVYLSESMYISLDKSRGFVGDYCIALFVSMNFFGISLLTRGMVVEMLNITKIIRYLASHTFSLYLFHAPLLLVYFAIFNNNVITIFLTFVTVFILGGVVEKQKDLMKVHLIKIFS